MEFMSLDSVGITLRSDGMCFSSYASDTSTLVAIPDTDLRVKTNALSFSKQVWHQIRLILD